MQESILPNCFFFAFPILAVKIVCVANEKLYNSTMKWPSLMAKKQEK